jgi:hypothetical protein
MARRNDPDALKLAAEADCDSRTAAKALNGQRIAPLARRRIERAAAKLKIKLPKEKS